MLAQLERRRAVVGLHLLEHARVVGRLHDHRHARVVLGAGADERRAADVDVLDALVVRRALRHRRLEGVEVDDDEIDRRDGVLGRLRLVLGVAAHGEQAAVDLGMQRLHAAVEHLGKSRQLRDVLDGEALGAQGRRRAPRRDELHAHAAPERGRTSASAGLVRDGQKRAADLVSLLVIRACSSATRSTTQLTSLSPKVAARSTICRARRGPVLLAK